MVADYFPHKVGKSFNYGTEKDQALRSKRSKPVAKADDSGKFGSRNPDGSMYARPKTKSRQVRPS